MRRFAPFALAAAALAVVYLYPPGPGSLYPRCLIHSLTGFECPGCGSTRALHALLHLRFAEAWSFNPLFICSLPLLAFASFRTLQSR